MVCVTHEAAMVDGEGYGFVSCQTATETYLFIYRPTMVRPLFRQLWVMAMDPEIAFTPLQASDIANIVREETGYPGPPKNFFPHPPQAWSP